MPRSNGFESIEAEVAAKNSQIIALLEDNLMNMTELYFLLENVWGCEFTQSEMRKQVQCAIIVTGDNAALFALAANVSQCEACGQVGVGLPKMLTCGGCKSYHYCSRKCQKKDWKHSHRLICTKENTRREHFKTTDACMNILAVVCIDWDTEAMNCENNHVLKHIEASGCKDCSTCSVLQCVVMCCSVLQCVAVCCSVLHCVAVCCGVLQCVTVCCSMFQCVPVCSSVL